ncbi:MAG TPA: phospholipase D-like domain-containing protein [Candidatus Binatia bacterium]
MTMYKFEWEALATDDLLRQLGDAAGVEASVDLTGLRPVVARVLKHVGGLPLCEEPRSAAECTAIARQWLHEATRHLMAQAAASPVPPGQMEHRSAIPKLGSVIERVERVRLNRAPVEQLAALGLDATVCRRVVDERTAHGRFASLDDFDDRVKGIGAQRRDQIARAVWFDGPGETLPEYPRASGDFARDVATLVGRQPGDGARQRLAAALDMLAAETAQDPHPAARAQRIRQVPTPLTPPETEAEWMGVLSGIEYYRALPALFDDARATIEVCMFHIACASPQHPTRALIDSLIAAHGRGVEVRVLMDQDREEDPYRSAIINAPAKQLFDQAGVACRFDPADKLLHSKFVIVDGERVIVGSHNWSAGSYFLYDDLSVVIESREIARQFGERFTRLWS